MVAVRPGALSPFPKPIALELTGADDRGLLRDPCRLFGGNMSLPIRQGKLFPNSPPPSKKFGKSLATIKVRPRRVRLARSLAFD